MTPTKKINPPLFWGDVMSEDVEMNEPEEWVVCDACGRSYPRKEENRIYYGEEVFLKCPHCGSTNMGVVIKKEDEGTVAEKNFDVDEEREQDVE